jgi:hypothetical protein
MIGKRQFSLGFLLFEVSCVATALGMFRVLTLTEALPIAPLFFLAGVAASEMAIGGCFGRPGVGATVAVLGVLSALSLLARFL